MDCQQTRDSFPFINVGNVYVGKILKDCGRVEVATAATQADQVGCPRVEGGIERYEGLREATPAKRATIRTAFEEVHTHGEGDKAAWETHARETTHIAIWEEEHKGVREATREQREQRWTGSMGQWNPGLNIAELEGADITSPRILYQQHYHTK